MKIYTIGFTKKPAKNFFKILDDNNIEQLVDIRLNNTSQLAGFTKRKDFKYFLKEILNIEYFYFDFLAPTKELRGMVDDWPAYTKNYLELLEKRSILDRLDPTFFEKPTVFLCSEVDAERCHRSILTDYLKKKWELEVVHL
jgi:uncharacterized protein (DUF488 family)